MPSSQHCCKLFSSFRSVAKSVRSGALRADSLHIFLFSNYLGSELPSLVIGCIRTKTLGLIGVGPAVALGSSPHHCRCMVPDRSGAVPKLCDGCSGQVRQPAEVVTAQTFGPRLVYRSCIIQSVFTTNPGLSGTFHRCQFATRRHAFAIAVLGGFNADNFAAFSARRLLGYHSQRDFTLFTLDTYTDTSTVDRTELIRLRC